MVDQIGQCWACGHQGVRLYPDPLVADPDDRIHICEGCQTRRSGLQSRYWDEGKDLKIIPPNDPKRDNPEFLGKYTVVKTVPNFASEFDDL